jgi:DNA-binding MarR family transcriptional regulator
MAKRRGQDEFAAPDAGPRRSHVLALPGENGEIATLLRQAASAHRLAEERLVADLGVTPPQLAALTLIGATPGLLAADLARSVKLTPQTVSLIIANLRRDGLVKEEESPSPSSRARPLALTPKGESVLRMGRERVEVASARLVEGMRSKRERALRRWLAGVASGMPLPGAALEEE